MLDVVPALHGGEVGAEVGDALLVLVLHDLNLQPQAVLLLFQLLEERRERGDEKKKMIGTNSAIIDPC